MIKFLIGMFLGLCIGVVAGFMMCALCSISKDEGDGFLLAMMHEMKFYYPADKDFRYVKLVVDRMEQIDSDLQIIKEAQLLCYFRKYNNKPWQLTMFCVQPRLNGKTY